MSETNEINKSLGELEEELGKLKTSIEYIESAKVSVEAASSVLDTAIKLNREFKVLMGYTSKLLEKIDKIDFPSRLDKLDSTVSSINQNISNTQARIESIERNLKDDFESKIGLIQNKLEKTQNKI